jgi:hypothetical protein
MTRAGGSAVWTSPQIVIATLSLLMAAGGSYLAIQRDDGKEMRAQIDANRREISTNGRDIAVLESRVTAIERDTERERDRDRRQ